MAAQGQDEGAVALTRTLSLTAAVAAACGGFLLFLQYGASDGLDIIDVLRSALRPAGSTAGSADSGRAVGPGDVLTVALNGQVRVLRIRAIGNRRGPATEALDLPHEPHQIHRLHE